MCNLNNVVIYCNRIVDAVKIIALQDLSGAASLDIGESLIDVVHQEVLFLLLHHA